MKAPNKEIYLTNGIGEACDNLSIGELEAFGVETGYVGSEDDGGYEYPLTEFEQQWMEEVIQICGYGFYGCYSTLLHGLKHHTPTLELPFYDEDIWEDTDFPSEENVVLHAQSIKRQVEPLAVERGGDVVIERDMPGRICVRMRYPFANAKSFPPSLEKCSECVT